MTAYGQDKFCFATKSCKANRALRDVKNITTATEAITVSCSLVRGEEVELCGALLCETAVCVKCHCCLFIASCSWHPALLCDTAGCEKCHCCLFIASCRLHSALLCDIAGCVKCHCCLPIPACTWHPALLCDIRACEVPLPSVHCVLHVAPCTAMRYNRVCEVPLLSVHCVLQVALCTSM